MYCVPQLYKAQPIPNSTINYYNANNAMLYITRKIYYNNIVWCVH